MHARLQTSGAGAANQSAQKPAQASAASNIPAKEPLQQTAQKPRSKFAKRFNMTGSGMTQANEAGLAASC